MTFSVRNNSTQSLMALTRAPASQPSRVTSLTTDRAFRIAEQNGVFDIQVGIGAGIHAAGGVVGFRVGKQEFTVPSQAGEPAHQVLRRLKTAIEGAGVAVKVEYPQTIDTLWERWSFPGVQGAYCGTRLS